LRGLPYVAPCQPSTTAALEGPSPIRTRPSATSWRVTAVWPSSAGDRKYTGRMDALMPNSVVSRATLVRIVTKSRPHDSASQTRSYPMAWARRAWSTQVSTDGRVATGRKTVRSAVTTIDPR
jgi:hypothetical protein